MNTSETKLFSEPINADNFKNLSVEAIAYSNRIANEVKDFYNLNCKGLWAKDAGKKLVKFLKGKKGIENIKFKGYHIYWETKDGMVMSFSFAPPEVD